MKKRALSVVMLASVISGCGSDDVSISPGKTTPVVTPVVENASVCFNESLYEVGAGYNFTSQRGAETAETESYKVLEDTRYRGQPAIHFRVTESAKLTENYIFINTGEKTVSVLGQKTANGESYYVPGRLSKFNLNKGDSYEQTVTETEVLSESTNETVTNIKTTFTGFETVTVPAGTYKTCKFEYNASITMPDGLTQKFTASMWYAAEHGLPVQSADSNGTLKKLIKADINGVKI
ncbi:hypothetical protein [Psychromonas aquimarina]|uniref:TapB family protein n=1 Tax=Psychromonas aquimarina TaxID=444919 RepID=UPI0003FBFB2E|nr:hypothetical protein [Psychromonas aquimarina]